MQMIDVLKRLAELDAANPNRPEYSAKTEQNISRTLSESTLVSECGMMPDFGPTERPATPASINMTAGSGEELGELIRAIASLSGASKPDMVTPLSASPAMAVSSDSGVDMRAMIDKLNPMDDEGDDEFDSDDEEKRTEEAYDNTGNKPTNTNEFDSEQYAHHENPPGAANGRGLANNPRAYETNESIAQRLMAEYHQFVNETRK